MGCELAYAAGVFDVRGSIILSKQYINQDRRPEVRLTVSTARHIDVVMWLKDTFGGTITNYAPYKKTGTPRVCWVLTGANAKNFLVSILPYMENKNRIRQIRIIKRYYNAHKMGPHGLTCNQKRQRAALERNFFNIMPIHQPQVGVTKRVVNSV